MLTAEELKAFLDQKAEQYEHPNFIESDPIQLPHRFHLKEDIEVVAFLIATIAWGNRRSIIQSGEKMLKILGESPIDFVMNYSGKSLPFVHRTFNSDDFSSFILALKHLYSNHGGLEQAFSINDLTLLPDMKSRIIHFRNLFFEAPHLQRTQKHVSNPAKGASAKRINMFLRWMVRSNSKGVDFGLWNSISTSELHLPLDVHISNNARRLGLLTRKQDDWKALEELMIELRNFDAVDPVKYDFALFGLGAFEGF